MTPRISSLERLPGLPSAIPWHALDAAMVHAAHSTAFLALKTEGDQVTASAYTSGTAFGDRAELRWLKRRAGWHCVLISDDGLDLGAGSEPRDLSREGEVDPSPVLLWGEKIEPPGDEKPYFYEGRIPHKLSYPACAPTVPGGGRLALKLRSYWLDDGECRRLIYRYAGFVAVAPPATEENT